MRSLCALLISSLVVINADVLNSARAVFHTTVNKKNLTQPEASIQVQLLGKPHHLFIGRPGPNDQILHQENIVLNNDGKSHTGATIEIKVDGPVNITCVNVFDQIGDGKGAYPKLISGGVGHNFIKIGVTTAYGRGFNFYVRIYGYEYDNTHKKQLL